MIKTLEELEALPPDTVVLEENGFVTDAESAAWHAEAGYEVFPATVLIPATISRERFEEVSDQWPYRSLRGSTLENFLAAFGIEVSNE